MRLLRTGAGLGGFLLTLLGAATLAAPGAEAAPGRCDPGTGVTVVVDYGPLGRSTGIGCDAGGGGDPASQVVPAAGFLITYASGQGFVCRIDGLPNAEAESCQRTPPADAYWGLFWNDGEGGGWVYSSQGVSTLRVPSGGSIGWRWQDGGDRELPGAAPNPPGPTSTPSDPPADGGGGGGDKPGQGDSATPTPTQSATSPAPTQSDSPSASKSAKPTDGADDDKGKKDAERDDKATDDKETDEAEESASPSESATDDATVVATEPTSSSTDPSGDGPLLLVAGAAVLALGGTAAFLAWRRRA